MFQRIDQSRFLSQLLDRISNLAARQRGLPVVVGIALLFFGFILQLITFFVPIPLLAFIAILCNGIGILTALIGLLLATPLGK